MNIPELVVMLWLRENHQFDIVHYHCSASQMEIDIIIQFTSLLDPKGHRVQCLRRNQGIEKSPLKEK
jgi:hypothetical protein